MRSWPAARGYVATPSPEALDAVAALLRAAPERTLDVARALRAPGRALDSTVAGMSMWPVIGPGARIRIDLCERARYEAGEVVAFVSHGQVVVHRVAHRGRAGAARGYVIARGDATLVPDPPVDVRRILGPVTGVWSDERWVAPGPRARRSWRARAVCATLLAVAVGGLYASPRATASLLSTLHRAAGPAWAALARLRRRRAPGSA